MLELGSVFALRGGRVVLGSHIALDGVDFTLDRGEFLVLLGGNGSGKSTLVKTLLGLVPLAAGELRIFGEPLAKFRTHSRIGYVPQRFTAVAGVPATVMEVVISGRASKARRWRGWGDDDRMAATRAVDLVGLSGFERSSAATLSGGEQQRVLIARALASEPEVLVLDEPVSGVDIEHQHAFSETLVRLRGAGATVLLVAHELGSMADLISRAVVLEAGRVIYDGPPLPHHGHEPHVHHHDQGPHVKGPLGHLA